MNPVKTLILSLALCSTSARAADKPNIIFIMTDDQGYGDASCYNPESQIPTPGIDRIAREGILFTDAHSGSAVCTPTRYGLLTGRYAWRSRLQSGVVTTGDGPLISKDLLTVPQLLKHHGYQTALVGKWHLGYSYKFPEGSKGLETITTKKPYGTFRVQAAPVGSMIIDGPVESGFDEFHGFHHAREMHSWSENAQVTEIIPLDQVISRSTGHSIRFIEKQTKAKQPFFLYLALGSPHTPIVPSDEWVGKSGVNLYADFVMETDHVTVKVLETLDRLGIADNTLIFFTTDNGCSPQANFKQLLAKGHNPSHSLRGMKSDAWDGGHRVPYVARWPGVIKPGRVSDDIICHNNLLATCAEILGEKLPDVMGVDSFSILPVLRGDDGAEPSHPFVIHHSINGRFAIRKGDWKFIACKGSGGWSKGGDGKPSQLYNMAEDREESTTLLHAEDGRRPNILFILADDQAPYDFKFYNPDSTLDSPQIDKLASGGMVFDSAHHMGSFSGAVCTPSRHMIMSGRTVWRLPIGPGAEKCPPNLEKNTIGAVFNRAGYATMRTCKTGNSYAAANKQFSVVHDAMKRGGTHEPGSAWQADRVLDYLNDREDKKDARPFFIYFAFSHPHDIRDGTPELLAKYGATNHTDPNSPPPLHKLQPPLPPNWLPAHPFDNTHMNVRDEVGVSGVWKRRDEATIRNEIGREYACSENIDIQIGRVLERLGETGELDNTYIFYTADHGMATGRHGLQGKQNLYEHSWRVPMIVKGPGIKPGSRVPGNIYLGDLLATFCYLTGVPAPETNEGTSFKPVLFGQRETVRDTLYGVYNGGDKPGIRSVKQGGWKLIEYESAASGIRETQLFNLADNPHEFIVQHHDPEVIALTGTRPDPKQTNLAADPAHATKLAEKLAPCQTPPPSIRKHPSDVVASKWPQAVNLEVTGENCSTEILI